MSAESLSPSLWVWAATVAGIAVLFFVDYLQARRPHVVSVREAAIQSAVYVAVALLFGVGVLMVAGADPGANYFAGYLIEKSLSVDNLFVFVVVLGAFAVPAEHQEKALLLGIAGALIMRAIFIAAGAAAIDSFSVTFVVFGAILLYTAIKLLRDHGSSHGPDPGQMRTVRLLRRIVRVTEDYRDGALTVCEDGRRAATPMLVAVVAILGIDLLFALDSIPAIFGITGDAYLVFTTNAFALLGLRALYFLVAGLLDRLVHLDYGLAAILAFIAVKLILHYAHQQNPAIPEIPISISLAVVVVALAIVTATSLLATRAEQHGR
ncbi:MAG: TerC/Alx family metal homeostasis membrane protein [Sciscionella sp.]